MSQSSGGAPAPEGSLRAAVETVPAGRRGQGRRYPLGGVLALAVCAQLCGCRSLYAIGQWGQDCGSALRVALGLSGRRGPSVATRHRVFRDLDHAAYERVLGAWFAAQGLEEDEPLAVDGKTLRGIHGEEIPGVHLVAVYAQRTRAGDRPRPRRAARGTRGTRGTSWRGSRRRWRRCRSGCCGGGW